MIEQSDGSDGFPISLTDQANDQNTDQANVLEGDTSLENVIKVSIPSDVTDALEIDEIVKDFKEQIKMGGTKCE